MLNYGTSGFIPKGFSNTQTGLPGVIRPQTTGCHRMSATDACPDALITEEQISASSTFLTLVVTVAALSLNARSEEAARRSPGHDNSPVRAGHVVTFAEGGVPPFVDAAFHRRDHELDVLQCFVLK